MRTRATLEVATASNDRRWWQIFWLGNTLGGVCNVLPGTRHGNALLGQESLARNLRHLLAWVTAILSLMMLKTRIDYSAGSHGGHANPSRALPVRFMAASNLVWQWRWACDSRWRFFDAYDERQTGRQLRHRRGPRSGDGLRRPLDGRRSPPGAGRTRGRAGRRVAGCLVRGIRHPGPGLCRPGRWRRVRATHHKSSTEVATDLNRLRCARTQISVQVQYTWPRSDTESRRSQTPDVENTLSQNAAVSSLDS